MKEKVYTVKEVSELLKIREEQVRNLLKKGIIKGFKVGKYWRVPGKEIEGLVEGVRNWIDWHEREDIYNE
jgi:excisionase family DNA binding protein